MLRRSRAHGAVAIVIFMLALAAAVLTLAGVSRAGASTERAAEPAPIARSVLHVGLTVSDADRSAEFFSKVLDFAKVSDDERFGPDVERLTGVFGARVRIVRMKLGEEAIELTEYLTP